MANSAAMRMMMMAKHAAMKLPKAMKGMMERRMELQEKWEDARARGKGAHYDSIFKVAGKDY